MGNFLSCCLLYDKISFFFSASCWFPSNFTRMQSRSSSLALTISRCVFKDNFFYDTFFRASSAHLRRVGTVGCRQWHNKLRTRPRGNSRDENNCRNYHNEIIFFNNFIVEQGTERPMLKNKLKVWNINFFLSFFTVKRGKGILSRKRWDLLLFFLGDDEGEIRQKKKKETFCLTP